MTLRAEYVREAEDKKEQILAENLPQLWILTPTASKSLLDGFNVKIKSNWLDGIYFLGDHLRVAIVAIHQLPKTEDTLWLRLLGRGKVQEQAIDEIEALPANHPLRSNVLRLLTNLQANLQAHQKLEQEEQDLVMKLSPLYIQWREEALQEGGQRTMRMMVESILEVKFGEIDEELSNIVEPLTKLTTKEAARLVWRLPREELLARLRTSNEEQ